MRGVFTREERAVVVFLVVSLLIGTAVAQSRRILPSHIPDFSGTEASSGEPPARPEDAGPVDINTAGVDDLVRLPGVGQVRAAEIVRVREQRGGFSSLDDLLDVRGIGPVTLDGLRSHAIVGGGAASADSCLVPDGSGS
jgi:competence ComEA-like helix-hairpin-helix protein